MDECLILDLRHRNIYFCARHYEKVIKKGCQYKDCTVKQPCFNYIEEKTPIYCVKHKQETMVNVSDKNVSNVI